MTSNRRFIIVWSTSRAAWIDGIEFDSQVYAPDRRAALRQFRECWPSDYVLSVHEAAHPPLV